MNTDQIDLVDEAPRVAPTEAAPARRRRRRPSGLLVRRTIGLSIILAFVLAVYWVVFRTDLLAPLLAQAAPAKHFVDWVTDDPKRAWTALAVLVIPHIGLYFMLFEDR